MSLSEARRHASELSGGTSARTIKALVMARFVPQRIRPFAGAVTHDDLLTLAGLIESVMIKPVIDRAYPLSEVPGAIGYLEQGHARGKIVVAV